MFLSIARYKTVQIVYDHQSFVFLALGISLSHQESPMNSPERARVLADNDWNVSESLKYDDCIFLNHHSNEEDGSLYFFETENPLGT